MSFDVKIDMSTVAGPHWAQLKALAEEARSACTHLDMALAKFPIDETEPTADREQADRTPTARLRRPAEAAPSTDAAPLCRHGEPLCEHGQCGSKCEDCHAKPWGGDRFLAGDLCRLRSGGPVLTVRTVTEDGVHVAWMSSDGVPFAETYSEAMLDEVQVAGCQAVGLKLHIRREGQLPGGPVYRVEAVESGGRMLQVVDVAWPIGYTPMRVRIEDVEWLPSVQSAGHEHTVSVPAAVTEATEKYEADMRQAAADLPRDPAAGRLRSALHDLAYGGEFAAWMRTAHPEMPFAAAREYDEAVALMTQIVGKPPRVAEPSSPVERRAEGKFAGGHRVETGQLDVRGVWRADPSPRRVRVDPPDGAIVGPYLATVIGSPCAGMLTVRDDAGMDHTVGERWVTELPA